MTLGECEPLALLFWFWKEKEKRKKSYHIRFFPLISSLCSTQSKSYWFLLKTYIHGKKSQNKTKVHPLSMPRFYVFEHNKKSSWTCQLLKLFTCKPRWATARDILHCDISYLTKAKPNCRIMEPQPVPHNAAITWSNCHLVVYESLALLWRNFGPLFLTVALMNIEVSKYSFIIENPEWCLNYFFNC